MALRAIRTVGGIGAQGVSGASTNPVQITFTGSLGTVGVSYTGSLAASGGASPYTYAIASGSLPPGLSLNTSTGAIAGTPTTPGTYSFQGQVTDNLSRTAVVNCSIMVAAAPGSLELNFAGSHAQFEVAYNGALNAIGGTQPYTFAISAGSLPPGLSLNTATGAIAGTPTAQGTFNFTGQVTDNVSTVQTVACSITVGYFDIPGAAVSSLDVVEDPLSPYPDANGGLHTSLDVIADVTGASATQPVRCRMWIDFDDGKEYIQQPDVYATQAASQKWVIGAQQQQTGVTTPGTIWTPTDPSRVNWKVALEANSHADQPSGSAVVFSITVTAAQACPSTDITQIQFVLNALNSPIDYVSKSQVWYWIWHEIDWLQPCVGANVPIGIPQDVFFKSSFATVQKGYEAVGTCTITGGSSGGSVAGVTLVASDQGAEVHVDGVPTSFATVNPGAQTFTLSPPVPSGAGQTLAIWRPAPDNEGADDPDAQAIGYRGRQFSDGPSPSKIAATQAQLIGVPEWSIPADLNPDGSPNLYRTYRHRVYAVSRLADNEAGGTDTVTLQAGWPPNADGSTDHGDLTPAMQAATLDLRQINTTLSAATVTGPVIANATITGGNIANATITGSNVASATITGSNIGSATITGGNIQSATVTGTNIAAATITGSNVGSATITGANIGSATITGANIGSGTITGANIAASTVAGSNIAASTVTGSNIAASTVTGSNIASATVTGSNIDNLTISAANIANLTINGAKLVNGTLTSTQVATGGLVGSNLANQTITATQIANATITGTQIANATITGSNISNATITGSNLQSGTITGTQIAAATITGSNIASSTITGSNIASATITATQIASATITATQIANLTITGSQIANLTIDSTKISSLDVGKLNAGTVSVALTLTAPTIQVTSGTVTINIDATNFVKLHNSSSSATVQATGDQITVSGTSSRQVTITPAQYDIIDASNRGNLSTTALGFDTGSGLQTVVKGRQTGPGTPSFASFSDVQTWCQNFYNALRASTGHGLVTG